MYHSLSKIALASATLAALVSLTACGGGGSSGGGQTVTPTPVAPPQDPVVTVPNATPGNAYPASLTFNQTLASMYTLNNSAACDAYDAYCRMVSNKEGYLTVELDTSVTSVTLQITNDAAISIRAATVPADCNAACWLGAPNGATMQLAGERSTTDGKNVFRIRIPAHVNNAKTAWLLSIGGPVVQNGVVAQQTYTPKAVSRRYFESAPIKIVVVPMRINGVLPANFPNVFQIAQNVASHLPFAIADISVAAAVDIPNTAGLGTIEEYTTALRQFSQLVGATIDGTYRYGIFSAAVRTSTTAGLGFQPGYTAIGWDDPSQWSRTMTHEMGHNFSLGHVPCNTGKIEPGYPYFNGNLYPLPPAAAHPPFDLGFGQERLGEIKDVMGYCGGNFFSDYSIAAMWKYANPNAVAAYKVAQAQSVSPSASEKTNAAVFTLAELQTYWDTNAPTPIQDPATKGHVYTWTSGTSNAPKIRQLTQIQETALPGLALSVLHADGIWYSAIAYRTSDDSALQFWSPGVGAPLAVQVKGI